MGHDCTRWTRNSIFLSNQETVTWALKKGISLKEMKEGQKRNKLIIERRRKCEKRVKERNWKASTESAIRYVARHFSTVSFFPNFQHDEIDYEQLTSSAASQSRTDCSVI